MTFAELRERPWDDASWRVASDTAWQAGLRWQQCWWRAARLGLPAGPFSRKDPDRLVGSTLAFDAPADANFLTAEAASAAERRLQEGGGGIVGEDRLRRFLLSSQPMCFNVFGHFQDETRRAALLGWVCRHDPDAVEVTKVEIEWAPPPAEHFGGGSAFDAFLEYRVGDGGTGFLAVECKYHEHLPKTDVPKVRDRYREFTTAHGQWRSGVVERLDRAGLRQFWLNTLLAQSLLRTGRYVAGKSVVVACAADRSARDAYAAVRAELVDPSTLVWDPWEAVVGSIDGHADWRELFVTRYLDFRPVAHLFGDGDPRLTPLASPATALAVASRVLADGGVLEQLADSGPDAPQIWSRLTTVVDELKRLRLDAGELLERDDQDKTTRGSPRS